MRRRLKKKKGLLKDPQYEKLQKRLFWELEEEARVLERRAERQEEQSAEFPEKLEKFFRDGVRK